MDGVCPQIKKNSGKMTTTDLNNNLLDHGQVGKAVNALFQYRKKQEKKDAFLIDGENIHMQLTFKVIPDVKNKIIKIPLPTTLLREASDVCLFVKDLDKNSRDSDPTVDHFNDLLSAKGVKNITEVIPLKVLKLEYGPFEAKRNLSNMYDFFLADERIMRLLPSLLGKSFYGRKRHPISVDLLVTDLKREVDRTLGTTRLIISGRGSNSQVTVAHTAMTEKEVIENVIAAAERITETLPGGAVNIRNIHLRLQDSPSLPIYVSDGSNDEVRLPECKRKLEEDEPEEISTLMEKKVKITPIGEISFYSLDGERLTKDKPVKPQCQTPKGKNTGPKGKEKSHTKVKTAKVKNSGSKVNRLSPKKKASNKGLSRQNDKKRTPAESLEKIVGAKSEVKRRRKSKRKI